MSERPILFGAPMIRALLEGRKTQTRRVVTTREPLQFIGGRGEEADPSKWGWFFDGPDHNGYMVLGCGHDERHNHGAISIPCPFGEPGDRLWCRETFSTDALTVYPCPPVWYRADCGTYDDLANGEHSRSCDAVRTGHPIADCFACAMNGRPFRWKPSIFMPRKLSRITLEVTEVRVQRLQEITEDDAREEGVHRNDAAIVFQHGTQGIDEALSWTARGAFAVLWDSINARRAPWASDPWVRAVSFRRVT